MVSSKPARSQHMVVGRIRHWIFDRQYNLSSIKNYGT